MTKKDVRGAFGEDCDTHILIGDGWLQRYYQYFKPTEKLLQLVLPDEIEIKDISRINGQNIFKIKTIENIFECSRTVAKAILNKWFVKSEYGYWRRSDGLDELLADGDTKLSMKEDK